jgi:VanZ family protein
MWQFGPNRASGRSCYAANMGSIERLFRSLSWACIGLLAVLSLTPGDYMVRTPAPGLLEHFVAYLGTGAIASVGYGQRVNSLQIAGLLWGYAALLEIGQNWAPGRHPQFMDFAIGAAGAVAGVVLVQLWRMGLGSRATRRT